MKSILAQDHYSLLEVNRFAPKSEIVKAYHRLKAAFDPESVATYSLFDPTEALEIRARVEEAFRVLIDERKKEAYDRWLKAREDGQDLPEPVFSRDAANDQVAAAAVATAGTTEVKPFIPKKIPMLRPVPPGGFPRVVEAPAPPPPPAPAAPKPVPVVDEEAVKALLASDRERDGAWLRAMREARGLSIPQVAEKTKIGQMYIRFVEENNYRDLPAAVYLRGHLVQMAKLYKLEQADAFAEAYMAIAERRKKT